MSEDIFNGDPAEVAGKIEAEFRSLHAKVAEGDRTMGELRTAAQKAATDLERADKELARLKNLGELQADARRIDGSEAELRHFVTRDGAQETVRLFGGNVTYRGHDMGYQPGLLDCPQNHGEWHREAKDLTEAMWFKALIFKNRHESVTDANVIKRAAGKEMAQLEYHLKRGPGSLGRIAGEMVSRVFTDTDGSGGEFIPGEVVMPELDRATKLTNYGLVSDNLQVMELQAKNTRMPFLSSVAQPYLYGKATVADPSDFTDSTPTTADRLITPQGLAVRIAMDRDALDDSVVPALVEMREIISRSLALAREDINFNGDTANTHQDDIANWNPNGLWPSGASRGGSGDHRRGWLGWRARAFDADGVSGYTAKVDLSGTLTYAKILQMAGLLDTVGAMDGDLILAMSYAKYLEDLLGITEVATIDKYGDRASVISGEAGRVGPFRVARSPALTSDLNDSGLYDNATKTKSGVLALHTARYKNARRRDQRVELDVNILNGVVNLVATCREILYDRDNGASIGSTPTISAVFGFNL